VNTINVGIIGVGHCASSLVQGVTGVVDPVSSLLMKAPPRPLSESAALAALSQQLRSGS
jgi:myo-inositol-1-phosphate synthase